MSASFFALLASASFWHCIEAQTLLLQLSQSPPVGVSRVVNPSFAGFGIEPSNLFSFAGYDTPNQLSINLLENLANFTGTPPHVRIGGNTQDYMVYSDAQLQWTWINNPNAPGAGPYAPNHMLIGPHFYDAINRFPQNTPVTYGLNMAYQESDYADVISTLMQQAIERLDKVDLVSFEIGNEPDLWLQNGFRTGAWGGRIYTEQWLDRAKILCQRVLRPRSMSCDKFEPAGTASTIGIDFQIKDLVTFGIADNARGLNTSFVSSWNQHDYYYFIGVSDYPLTMDRFLTFPNTRDQFEAWTQQIAQSEQTPFAYALREMGIVGPIGLTGITDTFAAALWTLNFFLYAATLNITMVGMHMTDNSNASAWQPIEIMGRQPFVRPLYYAFAAFDQAIGPSCQARVATIGLNQIPTGYEDHVEAYSIYQGNVLSSIVLINGRVANVSDISKGSLTVTLALPSAFGGKQLYLAYLANEGADSVSGTSWNGLSFEQSGDGTRTQVKDAGHAVIIGRDGKVSVTVRDSEALVAQIDVPVGEIAASQSMCSNLRATGTKPSEGHSSSSVAHRKRILNGSQLDSIDGVSVLFLGIMTMSFLVGMCMIL